MPHSDICKIIFAIILPPLGVFLERGCGADLLINILLTILGELSCIPSGANPWELPSANAIPVRLHSRHHPCSVYHPEVLEGPNR